MTLANLAGLWFLLAAIPVILLHMLKPRRAETVISSRLLWPGGTPGSTAATPWQRLRTSLPLILQLLAVALIALALANPSTSTETGLAPHTVAVIDVSASMGALDGEPDRLAAAQAEAVAMWDELPTDGTMSLIVAGPEPRVAVTATGDREVFERAVRAVRPSDGPADITAAMALADGLETPERTVAIVLLSDGRHSREELASLPLGLSHRMIGAGDVNRTVTELVVIPTEDGLQASATVAVTGGPAATMPLRFDVDGRTEAVIDVEVDENSRRVVAVELPPGEQVVARLGGEDLLAIDNTAYAVARQRRDLSVAIIGEPGPFITALMESMPGVSVVDPDVDPADVLMFLGAAVPDDVARPFVAFAPPGGVPGIAVEGEVEQPVPVLVRNNDPVLVGLDLSSLQVATAQQVVAPTAERLIAAEGAPLMLRGTRDGLPFIYFTFELADSTLPLDVSFPVMGERIIADLGGAAGVPIGLDAGDSLAPPAGRAAVIIDPSGTKREVGSNAGSVTVDRPGFWTVTAEDTAPRTVAVGLPVGESSLSPLPVAPTEPRPLRAGEEPPQQTTSWRWLPLLLAILVAAVEWLTARRRVGVPVRQWRLANGLRVLACALAVLALLGISLPRSADSVAAVFVLDRSDSVGAGGRNAGLDLVSEARVAAPDDAQVGVVVVGDGARVERLLSPIDTVTGLQATSVDPDRTNLAAGLRLAGAVLPDDARRRVVVVSDGRVTTGDANREARALAERGIPVDYVLVDGTARADAAVESIRAPARITDGATVAITATVRSTAAQPATLTLRRDGEVVGSSDVALNEGLTTVTLRDTPDDGGLHSYDVTVGVALDDRPQNDTVRTTVTVDGPAGVLVVEGSAGAADALSAGLRSGQLSVDQVPVTQLPPVDRLAGYDSIVLVDVDAADLADSQIQALVRATRDLGRGLVTIGGPQSYGMGSYRDTELEGVLPVISDILDPERRRTVAEVLAIDTSESMGECHCDEGFAGPGRDTGGVNKTDIARAGAARAIDALGASDQVGVLAVDTRAEWVIDLQALPSDQVVQTGLAQLSPSGGTNLTDTLTTAADALRESNASLKHIILFSDGFTEPGALNGLENEAGDLYTEEGITVSVVATGEGAAPLLEPIAIAGGGRFYPGRDLTRIPEILTQEAIIAARDFITEGEFLPVITASSPVVDRLDASPTLLGYVATTAQPTARTLLAIGDDDDPLLATWQVGLGRSTAWTSDAGVRWGQNWTTWDGYVDFWTTVVTDTFPIDSGGGVRAVIDGDEMTIRAEVPSSGAGVAAPIGSVQATVTDPTGQQRTVPLRPVSGGSGNGVYEGALPVDSAGSFTVGVMLRNDGGSTTIGSDLATKSYAAEYQPGAADESVLARLSELTGGRGAIQASQVFDDTDLVSGTSSVPLAPWLLLGAGLSWLLAIALSRFWLRRSGVPIAGRPAASTSAEPAATATPSSPAASSSIGPATPAPQRVEQPTSAVADVPAPPVATEETEPATTLDALLRAKREREG